MSTQGGDLDVIVCALTTGLACVQVFNIRAGLNLGNKSFFPKVPEGFDEAQLMTAFIGQYYLQRDVPAEVIVSHVPDDYEALTQMLCDKSGHRVTISASVRSEVGEIGDAILFGHVSDIRGERVVCIPFSDYCDPLVTEPDVWATLIEPILALEVPVSLRCLRNQIPLADDRFGNIVLKCL